MYSTASLALSPSDSSWLVIRTNLLELGVDLGEIEIRTTEAPVDPLSDVPDA